MVSLRGKSLKARPVNSVFVRKPFTVANRCSRLYLARSGSLLPLSRYRACRRTRTTSCTKASKTARWVNVTQINGDQNLHFRKLRPSGVHASKSTLLLAQVKTRGSHSKSNVLLSTSFKTLNLVSEAYSPFPFPLSQRQNHFSASWRVRLL